MPSPCLDVLRLPMTIEHWRGFERHGICINGDIESDNLSAVVDTVGHVARGRDQISSCFVRFGPVSDSDE